jgi:flagellar M-ring protein FliF
MAEGVGSLQALTARWKALPFGVRFGVIVALLAGIAYYAVTTVMARNPSMTVLFSNLAEEDAAQIVERLRASNIRYQLEAGGTTILVPEASVYDTRLMLTSEGLPNGGGVGFEVFDTQRFGESEFSEQVKYHRALEGELSRTISHLSGVQRARVHLVLPTRSLFASAEQGARASVVLHLKPGFRVRDDQVKGIIHLVASSVRDLNPENVTLVDGNGKRLGGSSSMDGDRLGESDSFRRDLELSKERSAQQLLDATLGPGRSIVRVAAQLNMTREEWTEERFDPQSTATRSFQTSEERDGARDNVVAGVPGAPSNLPGADAATTAPTGAPGGSSRRTETRNYEISKVLRKAIEPVGRITNMQIAVVVDGNWSGPPDKRKFEPLPKAELDRIAQIVTAAVGADDKRGDKVLVECVPFPSSPIDTKIPDEPGLKLPPWWPYAAAGIGALVLIVLVLLMRKLFRRKQPSLPATVSPLSLGTTPAVNEPAAQLLATTELLNAKEAARNALPDEAVEQVRQMAADLAAREPEAAARVIRGWLTEGKP